VSYEAAMTKAWKDLANLNPDNGLSVNFFSSKFSVDSKARKILSGSENSPPKDFTAILLLHYLIRKLKGLPGLENQWISFKELEAGEIYYPAFRKRSIEPLLKKYGANPQALFAAGERLSGRSVKQADAAIVVEAFEGVPILIELWKGDEEFKAEANLLFDRSISGIFCTEDIAVLAGFVAKYV
jgi:hypothetical protein